MGLIPTIELEGRPIAPREQVPHAPATAQKILELSTWMVILGTVRLVCAIADYLIAGLEATWVQPTSIQRWSWFFQENHPFVVLGSAWPLLLGLALRRTRWLELLKAGALTFFILSIGSMLTILADWSDHHGNGFTLGSFHISLPALEQLGLSAILLGLLGVTQLLLEFATAARATMLAFRGQAGVPIEFDRQTQARRERFGRLAVCTSVAFLILMVRLPAWSAYLELLNQSRVIREFILRDDFHRIRSVRPSSPQTAEANQIRDLETLWRSAVQAWGSGRYFAAWDDYMRLAVMLEAVPRSSMSPVSQHLAAQALNGWAWLLATCPEVTLRNPKDAVKYASRAVELDPNDGEIWNTLGVSYYRLGNWEEARSALYRSMDLRQRGEGDGFDWFFLAMIHAKLGHQERARRWYDRATEWYEAKDWSRQNDPGSAELYRQAAELYQFQVEAALSLGLPKPDRIPISPDDRMIRPPTRQMHPRKDMLRTRSHIIEPGVLVN
jgi:tetratricopeptide (TPR) repeat protein